MKKIITIVFTMICFLGFGQSFSKNWKDINYASDSAVSHQLDIYLPTIEKSVYPVVVCIYGSAWMSNSSKGADLPTLGKFLLDAGYALVMPNHRASGEAKFPAQVHDIKAAIRFVRANAEEYQFDTCFVAITGSSSGGNLAAIAGTSRFVKQYSLGNLTVNIEGSVGSNTEFSSSVDAVVDWFGPTNMLVMDSCGGTDFIHNDAKSPASLYIGGPIQENKEKTLLASPITYVDPSDPPFLIFHGDKDSVVPYCQSEILFKELQKAKVPSKLYLMPDGQHGPGVQTEMNMNLMVDFFNHVKINKMEWY